MNVPLTPAARKELQREIAALRARTKTVTAAQRGRWNPFTQIALRSRSIVAAQAKARAAKKAAAKERAKAIAKTRAAAATAAKAKAKAVEKAVKAERAQEELEEVRARAVTRQALVRPSMGPYW